MHIAVFVNSICRFLPFSKVKKGWWNSFQYLSKLVCLFLLGRNTLEAIFYHLHNFLFTIYKCIKEYFEKPSILLFQQYPVAPLVLHLAQWRLANEVESLMVVQYSTKPRNPE